MWCWTVFASMPIRSNAIEIVQNRIKSAGSCSMTFFTAPEWTARAQLDFFVIVNPCWSFSSPPHPARSEAAPHTVCLAAAGSTPRCAAGRPPSPGGWGAPASAPDEHRTAGFRRGVYSPVTSSRLLLAVEELRLCGPIRAASAKSTICKTELGHLAWWRSTLVPPPPVDVSKASTDNGWTPAHKTFSSLAPRACFGTWAANYTQLKSQLVYHKHVTFCVVLQTCENSLSNTSFLLSVINSWWLISSLDEVTRVVAVRVHPTL